MKDVASEAFDEPYIGHAYINDDQVQSMVWGFALVPGATFGVSFRREVTVRVPGLPLGFRLWLTVDSSVAELKREISLMMAATDKEASTIGWKLVCVPIPVWKATTSSSGTVEMRDDQNLREHVKPWHEGLEVTVRQDWCS